MAISTLTNSNKPRKETQLHIEPLLLEGLESGKPIPITPEYWKTLKAELTEEINNN